MTKETSAMHSRNLVAFEIREAQQALSEAKKALKTAEEAVKALAKASSTIKGARKVAERKIDGYRPLPKRVLNEVDKAIAALDKHARAIKAVPVTSNERTIAKAKRDQKKRA